MKTSELASQNERKQNNFMQDIYNGSFSLPFSILLRSCFSFLYKMGQTRQLFCLFSFFSHFAKTNIAQI